MKNLLVFLFPALLLAGCTTITHYKSQVEAGPAKAEDYPIYLYPEQIGVPRPFEVIGSVSVRDTPFTVFGGSFEGELDLVRKEARQKGADAIKLTSVEQPDFLHAKYRIEANLIRWTDGWEKIPLNETEFLAYLRDNSERLDPIEGIWTSSDAMKSRIGIMRNNIRRGREFVGFIFQTKNPTWQPGDMKLELKVGEREGVYRGYYYRDDYRRNGMAFVLGVPLRNSFYFHLPDDSKPLIFTKE